MFPAYAGVNRAASTATTKPFSVPRLRGDEPLIGEVSGDWIEAVCIGTGLDRETLDTQTVDVLVQLTARVIEVNADFLARGVACVRGGGRGADGDFERGVRGWIVRLLAGGFELTVALALPWPVARDYLEAIREAEQGRLYEVSLALRRPMRKGGGAGWRRSVVRREKQTYNLNANPGRHDHHRKHIKEHVPEQFEQQ